MDTISVRYWAGARAAAGTEQEHVALPAAALLSDVLETLAEQHTSLAPVLAVSTILRDGQRLDAASPIRAGDALEVLPPFAGG